MGGSRSHRPHPKGGVSSYRAFPMGGTITTDPTPWEEPVISGYCYPWEEPAGSSPTQWKEQFSRLCPMGGAHHFRPFPINPRNGPWYQELPFSWLIEDDENKDNALMLNRTRPWIILCC